MSRSAQVRQAKVSVPKVQFDAVLCTGGLDLVTPTISLKNGFVREGINFECGVTGGYSRIVGYERFDGHTSPTTGSLTGQILGVTIVLNVPVVGATVTGGTSGATATISYLNGLEVGVAEITGTFVLGDVLTSGGVSVGVVNNLVAGPNSPLEQAIFQNSCATIYRNAISAVPGSGSILGVFCYLGTVYAFRNNSAGTAACLYKSSATGWVLVPYFQSVSFTAGSLQPVAGDTLVQGSVSATIMRVAWCGGVWAGSAFGQFIITNLSGGNFSAGNATTTGLSSGTGSGYKMPAVSMPIGTTQIPLVAGSGTILAGGNVSFSGDPNIYSVINGITGPGNGQLGPGTITIANGLLQASVANAAVTLVQTIAFTLSGPQTQIGMLPGGKFEFADTNFFGQAVTERIYGVDGVNPAFEFDGTTLVPIFTGAAPETPSHLCVHREYLFLSIQSSYFWSAPGAPYDFTAIDGGGEAAVGQVITAMVSMPGAVTYQGTIFTLGIFSRFNTYILYGASNATWSMVSYNTGNGANAFTARNMAQTFAFDDAGVIVIQSAIQYGNFSQDSITSNILPFIYANLNLATYAALNRDKSQYRIFFSNGYGLYITVVNGKTVGCMPVYFPDVVQCCYEGRTPSGREVTYFGTSNGFVMQLDKGTSFDGANINYQLVMNYTSEKSPQVVKRFRRASVEIMTQSASYVDLQVGYSLGYSSQEYMQASTTDYTMYLSNSNWDAFTWDNFFYDTTGNSPFRVDMEGTAENVAMAFSGSSAYVPAFTINSIMIHFTPRRVMR